MFDEIEQEALKARICEYKQSAKETSDAKRHLFFLQD
jgi:hypothetical protein